MPFLQHIDELRRRVMVITAVLFIGSIATYYWSPQFFDLVMAPIRPLLKGQPLVNLGPFEAFGLRFKIALYMAGILGSPIIIWQVMAFFLPALKPGERRYVVPTFLAMVVLFAAGVWFCYTYILGTAFAWMLGQQWAGVSALPQATLYFSAVTLLLIGFGVAFQLPVIVFYLVLFRIVPYRTLRENWRVAYVVLMIVASIATPDWSPVTMGALFAVLLGLYEGSLLLARVLLYKRIAAEKRAELEA